MQTERNAANTLERALEKAAKIICSLQYGRCPVQEKNFPGCPTPCTEDIVPWQCWVAYLRATAAVAAA
ncbi:hypothetical protein [Candidatus Electronema sp. TJ]|uniref:hypothetical protein n=1 Tax=Candidatus Electronema sp. TJ TaxID=3401573 RepID=UPI003AA911ED